MEYREVMPEDVAYIAGRIEQELTHGDEIVATVLKKAAEGRYFGVKAVADDGRIAAFYTYTDDCVDFTVPHPELERRIREIVGRNKVITGDAMFVEPEFRHRGIATELSHQMIAHAKARGVRYLVTEAWMHPDAEIPARQTLLHYGTVVMEETIPMFYRGMEKYGMECPICGRSCRCGAQVQLHRL